MACRIGDWKVVEVDRCVGLVRPDQVCLLKSSRYGLSNWGRGRWWVEMACQNVEGGQVQLGTSGPGEGELGPWLACLQV
jgi:hypothetical protein